MQPDSSTRETPAPSSAPHEGAELGDVEVDGERRDLPINDLPYFGVVLVQPPAGGRDVVVADDGGRVVAVNDQLSEFDALDGTQKAGE